MPHVPWMHDIENAVAHDNFFLPRPRADQAAQFITRLYLTAILQRGFGV
jgi:hypothetical protein